MFLFGMAFLLLETRSVTAMNLAWGATWVTSAVVFGSILAVALLATLCAGRWRVPFALAASCLMLSLVALYLLPATRVLAVGGLSRLALSVLLVGTPVFFAALLFGALYRDRVAVAGAFGWNLLGAMTGGLLEDDLHGGRAEGAGPGGAAGLPARLGLARAGAGGPSARRRSAPVADLGVDEAELHAAVLGPRRVGGPLHERQRLPVSLDAQDLRRAGPP